MHGLCRLWFIIANIYILKKITGLIVNKLSKCLHIYTGLSKNSTSPNYKSHRWSFLFVKIADGAHILTIQLNTGKDDKSVQLLKFIKAKCIVFKVCFWDHLERKMKLRVAAVSMSQLNKKHRFTLIFLIQFPRWINLGCLCPALEKDDLGGGGDEIQVPACLATSLWETIKFSYKSAQKRRQMYIECIEMDWKNEQEEKVYAWWEFSWRPDTMKWISSLIDSGMDSIFCSLIRRCLTFASN